MVSMTRFPTKPLRITPHLGRLAAIALVLCAARAAWGVDIEGVHPAAFALPELNGSVQPTTGGSPYRIDILGDIAQINTEPAYLDTGTSGIIISDFVYQNWTRNNAQIPIDPGVTFFDLALGGTVEFGVTMPVNVRLASSASLNTESISQYETVYDQAYSSVRLQVAPPTGNEFDVGPNIYGMPVMVGKTAVIDPTVNINEFVFQQSYVYPQGTPFNPSMVDTNPGIPTTSHHVKLSFGDFSQFTHTEGGEGPTLAHNPLIGPDPIAQLDGDVSVDDSPPVGMSFGGLHATGTMLYDTGAVASFLSAGVAASFNVRYSTEVGPDGQPLLETFDPQSGEGTLIPLADQFTLPIAGIDGQPAELAGFYLDELVLHTVEGSLDDADPNNLRYLRAPVLVLHQDFVLTDPNDPTRTVTLDGILGSNFFLATASLDLEEASASPYRWVTFDEPNGMLGLDLAFVPEPSSCALAALALMALAGYGWRRRRFARRHSAR